MNKIHPVHHVGWKNIITMATDIFYYTYQLYFLIRIVGYIVENIEILMFLFSVYE